MGYDGEKETSSKVKISMRLMPLMMSDHLFSFSPYICDYSRMLTEMCICGKIEQVVFKEKYKERRDFFKRLFVLIADAA